MNLRKRKYDNIKKYNLEILPTSDFSSTDDESYDSLNDFIVDDTISDDIMDDESIYFDKKCDRNCLICKINGGHMIERELKKDKYFRSLDDNMRIHYIREQADINEYDKQLVPIRYRILLSPLDIKNKSIILSRINDFETMSQESSEYGKMKKWIDGISKIPFGNYINLSVNSYSSYDDKYKFLCYVNIQLNKSIYGQLNAKNKILEIVSQWISNPKSRGSVIALQGPPGIGKTTLIKSGLANALNIPFCFIALGGATDASTLEGHSFTYEGSSWGKIVDMLMQVKCMNPIIFFDELDKVSKSDKGQEIINILMHLTDRSQNDKFHDTYFGLDFDLSRTTLIFSCNDESEINYILNDRIEYVRMNGFSIKEKIEIVKNYMIPEIAEDIGLAQSNIYMGNDCIEYIIRNYTKEEGVRKLRECVEKIYSKINFLRYIKDGRGEIEINYNIKNFKLPITLKNSLIKILLD